MKLASTSWYKRRLAINPSLMSRYHLAGIHYIVSVFTTSINQNSWPHILFNNRVRIKCKWYIYFVFRFRIGKENALEANAATHSDSVYSSHSTAQPNANHTNRYPFILVWHASRRFESTNGGRLSNYAVVQRAPSIHSGTSINHSFHSIFVPYHNL